MRDQICSDHSNIIMSKNINTFRTASIIIISAGYGWAGGHYIPPDSSPQAYLFQIIIILVLLILGTGYLGLSEEEKLKKHWSIRGLTIFSILSLVINVGNIIHGAMNKSSNRFGSHNSAADLIPIGIILTGTILWLGAFYMSAESDKRMLKHDR
jgi:hypothetical protein